MAAAGARGYLAAVPTTSTKLFASVCHLTFDVFRVSQIIALILCVSLLRCHYNIPYNLPVKDFGADVELNECSGSCADFWQTCSRNS